MTLRALFKQAYDERDRPSRLQIFCVVGILLSIVFPTDLLSYRATPVDTSPLVVGTDHYGRFVNTAVQAALPIVTGDSIGFVQLVYVALGTTAATHGLKFLLDKTQVWDARLGERPNGGEHNMPSGHSSMASCAVYFVCRRYGWWHALYMVPILLLTMYARVQLEAHTIPAVIAGALVGILMAAIFTGKRRQPPVPASPAAPTG